MGSTRFASPFREPLAKPRTRSDTLILESPVARSWAHLASHSRSDRPVVAWCFARLLITPITFAFIGHPRTLSDVPRKFPFASLLPLRFVERWFRYQWPFVASYITGLTLTNGTLTTGAMLISPLTTEQMIRNPRLARQRVLQTVRLAEKMGATIAGLGAFTSSLPETDKNLSRRSSSD